MSDKHLYDLGRKISEFMEIASDDLFENFCFDIAFREIIKLMSLKASEKDIQLSFACWLCDQAACGEELDYKLPVHILHQLQNQYPFDNIINRLVDKSIKYNLSLSADLYDKTIFKGGTTDENCQFICNDFSSVWKVLREIKENITDEILLYRGQENSEWGLVPSIQRGSHQNIRDHKDLFKKKAKYYIDGFDDRLVEESRTFELEAEMQHYGIPTNYLDWSESPLIALYFALSKEGKLNMTPISNACLWVAVVPKKRLIQIKNFKKASEHIARPVISFLAPSYSNKRIGNQKSFFSYVELDENEKINSKCLFKLSKIQERGCNSIKIYKITIRNNFIGTQNRALKCELEMLGLSPTTIYPDYTGLKYEVDNEDFSIYYNFEEIIKYMDKAFVEYNKLQRNKNKAFKSKEII